MAMFNYITDGRQLEQTLNQIAEKVIDEVSKTLLVDFQHHLDETIYAAPAGTSYYRYYNKGGFYSGWNIDVNRLIRTLAFHGGKLVSPKQDYVNDGWAHGGYNKADRTGDMPWILNDIESNIVYSHKDGAKYFKYFNTTVGYWDSYLIDIDKKIEGWLDKEFGKYGISRR